MPVDASRPLFNTLVLVRGAGDLGSGVAYRLIKAGFPIAMTELPLPLLVRTTVSFGAAVLADSVIVEGIKAQRATVEESPALIEQGIIPVIVDPGRETLDALKPAIVVDARVAKINIDTTIHDASLVIALGPGFTANVDCHAVVETNRGHNLGRVYWQGSAEPDTGVPGSVNGKASDRVLRAPADGPVRQFARIGEYIKEGAVLARVGDVPLVAPFDGVLRGLIDDNVVVTTGLKIGDLDPRAKREYCFTISDKSLAIGGAVVEAILSAPQVRDQLRANLA